MTDLHPCICAMAACCMLVTIMATFYDHSVPSLHQVPGVHVPGSETNRLQIPGLGPKHYHHLTGHWIDVNDSGLHLLNDDNSDDLHGGQRIKRTGLGGQPSLSIVNPMDVLRQRMLLEIARRRLHQSEKRIEANRQFLKTIGKRSAQRSSFEKGG